MNSLFRCVRHLGAIAFAAATGLLCLMPQTVFAQGKQAWQEYDRLMETRRSVAALSADNVFGDSVDLYAGGLSFSATDVSIPGNSSLPVAVTRKFTVTNRHLYPAHTDPFGDWELDIPNVSGVFAPSWHDNRCDTLTPPDAVGGVIPADEFWSGNQVSMPGGGEMLQVTEAWPKPSTGGPYRAVTAGNTYFSCLTSIDNGTGQGFLAIGSDGTKYWLNHMASLPEPAYTHDHIYWVDPDTGKPQKITVSRNKIALYATRVEDRFGNWVTYSYSNTATQPLKLTRIDSNDGRAITLQYTGAVISSVSDGTHSWTYGYQNGSLSSVTLPDASSWQISFAALANAQIETLYNNDPRNCFSWDLLDSGSYTGTITHPSGAIGTYTVTPRYFGRSNVPALCRNYTGHFPDAHDPNGTNDDFLLIPYRSLSLALTNKQVSGPGLTTGQWNYAWAGTMTWQLPSGSAYPVCLSMTCLDPVCLSDDCAGTRSLKVTEPDGSWTRHVYGNSYRYNEGKLLRTETGTGSTTLRTISYGYNYATSGQPYSAKIGTSPQVRGAGFVSEYVRPMTAKVTTQQGTDFIWIVDKCTSAGVYCFDEFARPTKVIKASMATGTTEMVPPSGTPTLAALPTTSTSGSYTVAWNSVAYATRYELQERFGAGAWSTIHNAAGTSVVLSGKANGTWSYQVRACNAQGCAGWSTIDSIDVTVPPSTAPVVTAPSSSSANNYSVSWTTVSLATRYELDESTNGGAWTNVYNSTGTVRYFSSKSDGTYQYRARACNAGGCSGYSAVVTTVVTLAEPLPAAPATLTAPGTADATLPFTVSWSSVSGATSYRLERNKNGGSWVQAYSGTATSTSQNLGMPATYQYRAQACNASGCGAYSPTTTVTVVGE